MSQRELIESMLPDVPVLRRDQLAEVLNVPQQTLAAMACKGTGPAFVKVGKLVRYPRAGVVAWLLADGSRVPVQL